VDLGIQGRERQIGRLFLAADRPADAVGHLVAAAGAWVRSGEGRVFGLLASAGQALEAAGWPDAERDKIGLRLLELEALAHHRQGRYLEAADLRRRGAGLAARLGDPERAGVFRARVADSLRMRGDLEEAERVALDVLREGAGALSALGTLTSLAVDRGDGAEALRWLNELDARSGRADFEGASRGAALALCGRLEDAVRTLETHVERTLPSPMAVFGMVNQAVVLRWQAKYAEAFAALDRAAARAGGADYRLAMVMIRAVRLDLGRACGAAAAPEDVLAARRATAAFANSPLRGHFEWADLESAVRDGTPEETLRACDRWRRTGPSDAGRRALADAWATLASEASGATAPCVPLPDAQEPLPANPNALCARGVHASILYARGRGTEASQLAAAVADRALEMGFVELFLHVEAERLRRGESPHPKLGAVLAGVTVPPALRGALEATPDFRLCLEAVRREGRPTA